MPVSFALRHIPALISATALTFGGMWPLFNAKAAMLEFGFPARIAESPAAAPVMAVGMVRTTALGLLMFIFYFRGETQILDTFLAVSGGYLGLVDSYVVWKQGQPKQAVFRLISSALFSAWGFAGWTSGA